MEMNMEDIKDRLISEVEGEIAELEAEQLAGNYEKLWQLTGTNHPETDGTSFTFLGFTHIWGKRRSSTSDSSILIMPWLLFSPGWAF
jgi:hypothetical protein